MFLGVPFLKVQKKKNWNLKTLKSEIVILTIQFIPWTRLQHLKKWKTSNPIENIIIIISKLFSSSSLILLSVFVWWWMTFYLPSHPSYCCQSSIPTISLKSHAACLLYAATLFKCPPFESSIFILEVSAALFSTPVLSAAAYCWWWGHSSLLPCVAAAACGAQIW